MGFSLNSISVGMGVRFLTAVVVAILCASSLESAFAQEPQPLGGKRPHLRKQSPGENKAKTGEAAPPTAPNPTATNSTAPVVPGAGQAGAQPATGEAAPPVIPAPYNSHNANPAPAPIGQQNQGGMPGGGMSPMGALGAAGTAARPVTGAASSNNSSGLGSSQPGGSAISGTGGGGCDCNMMSSLGDAVQKTLAYKRQNAACIGQSARSRNASASNKGYSAINDYRGTTGCMYIIDDVGTCKFATASAFGNGGGAPPRPGCGSGSHQTPPGFHVTARHAGGARYNSSNSLLMLDLEGQGSANRGILIHYSGCRGGGCTWGCAGVHDFNKTRELLGEGSLVYNYFGPNTQSCGSSQRRCNIATANPPGYRVLENDGYDPVIHGYPSESTAWPQTQPVSPPPQ